MEKVDLGGIFEFLTTITKNTINFLTPGPEIFPKITTYAPPADALSTIINVRPWTPEMVTAPPVSAISTIAKVATKVAPAPTNIFTTVWDTIKGPAETFLDFFLTKGKLEAATSIAQSQADSQRAVQAVVEAQERAAAAQTQQQKEAQGILSTEAWKKAIPYVIPIAAGLAIVALLLVVKKGDKKKK